MTAQPGIKARGPGRPAYAKTTSCAAIFAYDCGAHTAHEVYYTMPAYRLGHKIGIIAALRLLYHSNKPDGLACRHSASANGFAVCTAQLCHVCQLAWHILFYSGKNESDLINEGAGRTPCSFVYNLYSQSPSAVQAGLLLQSCAEKLYQWVNAHVQAENFLAAPCTFPIGTASEFFAGRQPACKNFP